MSIRLLSSLSVKLGVGLILCLTALTAMAGDRVTERAFLEDPGGRLGWEEVRHREFQPFQGIFSRGYTPSAYWLKLSIAPGDPDPSGWLVLRIRPNHLDEVWLYDPLQGASGVHVTGDKYPSRSETYRSLNLNFLLPQGDQPRTVWLRIQTTGTMLVQAEVYPLAEALVIDNTQHIAMVLYIATLGFLAFWAGFHAWVSRDSLFGLFALKQTLVLLAMIVLAGYYRLYLGGAPGMPSADLLGNLCLPPLVSLGILFDYLLLRRQQPHRILLGGLLVLALIRLPYYALYASGHPQTAFMLLQIIVGLWPLWSLATDLSIPRQDDRPAHARPVLQRRQLILFHGLIVLVLLLAILPNLGLALPSAWVFDGYLTESSEQMSRDASAASESDVFMVPAYVELPLHADSEPISRTVNRKQRPTLRPVIPGGHNKQKGGWADFLQRCHRGPIFCVLGAVFPCHSFLDCVPLPANLGNISRN